MKARTIGRLFAAVSAALVLFAGIQVFGQRNYKVDRGERIRVRLENELNSKKSQVGDKFTTRVTEPVYSQTGVVVIPVGSRIIGRVDNVVRAKKGGKPGTIDVSFNELRLPNGTVRTVNGSLTSLDADDTKSDPEGTASGDKMKNRKIIFIGGGGAGGAVIGAAIGGGKGALIGGIAGAAGGLLGERLTKGKEAKVKSGTEFGVYINRAFFLPRFRAQVEAPKRDDEYAAIPAEGRTYVVQPGDTLAKISIRFYGTSRRYMDIYNANRDRLESPTRIEVGQRLRIP